MLILKSFLFCGIVCMIAQIILDNTKLSPGHITSIFVVLGAFLDSFSFYDKIIKSVGGGALLPITSFGHSLIHGALAKANEYGIIGILMGMFDLTATGITAAIIFAFVFSLIFKPKN
ncbi:MAG: stage V sporulation protein AE [Candidatus Faecimonas sp.]|nr:stage V sporulation protein AE [Mycoplasmatota bacterium]MDY2908600.1 stage V sporulation protein AE [Candidatus Faecimonas sp.]